MSSGSLQTVATILVVTSALAAPLARAHGADEPNSLWAHDAAAEHNALPGATLRVRNGWTASLFVSSFAKREAPHDDVVRLKSASAVNARLTRNLSKNTRVTFDVFNVFDRRAGDDYFSMSRPWYLSGPSDSFLFNPGEPRGFRLKLRTTF